MAELPTIEPGIRNDRGRPGILLRFPFHEGAQEDLKEEIASGSRRWDPEAKAWWVALPYLDTALGVLLRYFPEVMVLGQGDADDELISRDGSRLAQGRLL